MSAKSNPTNVTALHLQMAHEAEHRGYKYDKDGKRLPHSLPPNHPKGGRVVTPRRLRDV
jgi:hypothetical protein